MAAKQKLSSWAKKRKADRDKKIAMTPRRRKMKAENQRKRRAAKKRGQSVSGKDWDHTRSRWATVKENRGNYGRGTKRLKKK